MKAHVVKLINDRTNAHKKTTIFSRNRSISKTQDWISLQLLHTHGRTSRGLRAKAQRKSHNFVARALDGYASGPINTQLANWTGYTASFSSPTWHASRPCVGSAPSAGNRELPLPYIYILLAIIWLLITSRFLDDGSNRE